MCGSLALQQLQGPVQSRDRRSFYSQRQGVQVCELLWAGDPFLLVRYDLRVAEEKQPRPAFVGPSPTTRH